MRRVVSLLLVIGLALAFAHPCLAAESQMTTVSPRFAYISTTKVGISINETSGVAQCSAYCYAIGNYTVEVQCKLQRYTGSSWVTLKTWSSSGTQYSSVSEYWAVVSGYTYRANAVFRVRDSAGNLLESVGNMDNYTYV